MREVLMKETYNSLSIGLAELLNMPECSLVTFGHFMMYSIMRRVQFDMSFAGDQRVSQKRVSLVLFL